jgi:hypothetical protein
MLTNDDAGFENGGDDGLEAVTPHVMFDLFDHVSD